MQVTQAGNLQVFAIGRTTGFRDTSSADERLRHQAKNGPDRQTLWRRLIRFNWRRAEALINQLFPPPLGKFINNHKMLPSRIAKKFACQRPAAWRAGGPAIVDSNQVKSLPFVLMFLGVFDQDREAIVSP
jgi:hypothetical protein